MCGTKEIFEQFYFENLKMLVLVSFFVRFLQHHFAAQEFSSQSHFHLRRAVFSSQLKSKVGHILAKAAALRIIQYVDGGRIASRSHTHPSYTQTLTDEPP